MKRTIQYHTSDDRTFDSRSTAQKHETEIELRKRVLAQLLSSAGAADEHGQVTLGHVVDALCAHPEEMRDALSERAARRAMPHAQRKRRGRRRR